MSVFMVGEVWNCHQLVPKSTECYWDVDLILFFDQLSQLKLGESGRPAEAGQQAESPLSEGAAREALF